MDGEKIKTRAKLLQKYLKDEQKELQALYALQALMVQMEQPASEFLFLSMQFYTHNFLYIMFYKVVYKTCARLYFFT